MSMKIPEEIKQDFSREPLDAKSLLPDPFDQFEAWFSQACAENLPAPNAMSLATPGFNLIKRVRQQALGIQRLAREILLDLFRYFHGHSGKLWSDQVIIDPIVRVRCGPLQSVTEGR
jgi:hypothetical protein